MQHATVSAQGRLVVVPIPDDVADAEVIDAVEAFLDGHTDVPHCAAIVTWTDNGTLLARDLEPDGRDATRSALRAALSSLLANLFGTGVEASWGDNGGSVDAADVDDLSMSFLREVHDFVTPKTSFVAVLTDWVDPGAIVRELRHIHGLRVIYGGVPSRWTANRA